MELEPVQLVKGIVNVPLRLSRIGFYNSTPNLLNYVYFTRLVVHHMSFASYYTIDKRSKISEVPPPSRGSREVSNRLLPK